MLTSVSKEEAACKSPQAALEPSPTNCWCAPMPEQSPRALPSQGSQNLPSELQFLHRNSSSISPADVVDFKRAIFAEYRRNYVVTPSKTPPPVAPNGIDPRGHFCSRTRLSF